nr:hypothetical protein CFP56_05108 [Quercus suber]
MVWVSQNLLWLAVGPFPCSGSYLATRHLVRYCVHAINCKWCQSPIVMRSLGWNCRGICNASTVGALRAQMKRINPEVVFLCETKAYENHMEEVLNSFKFFDMVTINAKGRAGGLCMMWRNIMNVEVLEYNRNIIAVKIKDLVND